MVVIYGGIIDELQWAGFSVEKVNWNKQVFMKQVFEEKKINVPHCWIIKKGEWNKNK